MEFEIANKPLLFGQKINADQAATSRTNDENSVRGGIL